MSMDEKEKFLEFVPFSSCINPSFWFKLSHLKLDVDKLNEKVHHIWGYYSNLNSHSKLILEVDSTSFNCDYNGSKLYLPYHGLLINKNTVEQFKECNKVDLINLLGKQLLENINNGTTLKDPSKLNVFLVLSFADLKKYNFYYWFAFPALSKIKLNIHNVCNIREKLEESQLIRLCEEYNKLDQNNQTFFLINYVKDIEVCKLESKAELNTNNLQDYQEYLFAFSDPSSLKDHPGWPLRNYIIFLLKLCPILSGKVVKFLGFRLTREGSQLMCNTSIVFEVLMPCLKDDLGKDITGENVWTGYEFNERGKMGPRLAKMKDSMSPLSLAEAAVDLNLKLMKWRVLPDINLDKIKNCKCLLLGAGTLGCAVARNLLAWGIRTINFIDNGIVSFSNPVRQNLYTYEDCIAAKPKATAAAENLQKIFPNITSQGYQLSIPMPGHPVGQSLLSQTQESVKMLEELISKHDIIFLLMDSRESRWLPTLLGANFEKTVINAALGFDTYLIMRHGAGFKNIETNVTKLPEGQKYICGSNLGCYFCNDITAPGDSLKDRTLDQQCTVTRPGVSNIAGALAVELAISLTQHEKGVLAPALYSPSRTDLTTERENECILGIIPHSIRGFLSLYSHILPATERFNQCIACSDVVLKEYQNKGFDFLLEVFNSSSHLEDLTGLSNIYTEPYNEIWDLSDEESA